MNNQKEIIVFSLLDVLQHLLMKIIEDFLSSHFCYIMLWSANRSFIHFTSFFSPLVYLLKCISLVVQFMSCLGVVFWGTVNTGGFLSLKYVRWTVCICIKTIFHLFVELINKLNFLDEEEQDLANSSTNPFGDPDTAELNPFGDPDVEGNNLFYIIHG